MIENLSFKIFQLIFVIYFFTAFFSLTLLLQHPYGLLLSSTGELWKSRKEKEAVI